MPCRDMADALCRANGPVRIFVDRIRPGVLPGLGQDWFDILKSVALRPCGAGQLSIALGATPALGRDPEAVMVYHRLSELQAMGVLLRQLSGPAPDSGTLVIDASDLHAARAYRWPWANPLSPSLSDVRRNRLGREADAIGELGGPLPTTAATLAPLRDFNSFSILPGRGADPADPKYLGKLLAHPIEALMMIDPYVAHDPSHLGALDRFLRLVRPAAHSTVRLKTRKASSVSLRNRSRGADFTEDQQKAECRHLERLHAHLNLKIHPMWIEEHDRTILLRHAAGTCYKVILGQGVFGFEVECRSRTEGVWFEIDNPEFKRAWSEF